MSVLTAPTDGTRRPKQGGLVTWACAPGFPPAVIFPLWSEDGLTVTIRVKPWKWSNGETLCADNVLAIAVVRPGTVVSPPPKGTVWGRIAYATVVGDTLDECRAALDAAQAALRVEEATAPSLLQESHL